MKVKSESTDLISAGCGARRAIASRIVKD